VGRTQPLTSGVRSRSQSTTWLACVEWPVSAVQRSIDSSILEWQVTVAADIHACKFTDSNQP